jgi:hypothetical protein
MVRREGKRQRERARERERNTFHSVVESVRMFHHTPVTLSHLPVTRMHQAASRCRLILYILVREDLRR